MLRPERHFLHLCLATAGAAELMPCKSDEGQRITKRQMPQRCRKVLVDIHIPATIITIGLIVRVQIAEEYHHALNCTHQNGHPKV